MGKTCFMERRLLLFCMVCCVCILACHAEPLFNVNSVGGVSIGRAMLECAIADQSWHFYSNRDWKNITAETENGVTACRGEFGFGETVCHAFEKVSPTDDGTGFRIAWELDLDEEAVSNRVMSCLTVPVKVVKNIEINGTPLTVPATPGGETIAVVRFTSFHVSVSPVTMLTITSADPIEMEIFDSRVWNETNICFRFNHAPARGTVKSTRLAFDVAIERNGDEPVDEKDGDYVLTENEDWHHIDFHNNTIPGSPLDFSFLNDGIPAGTFGRMRVAADGHLAFENAPEKRIRLFGTNICFNGATPSHAAADHVAGVLRRMGYNTVRLHHIDTRWSLIDFSADDSITFIPERLDNFFYLIHALEKQGMYITIDLYSARTIKPGDGIEGVDSIIDNCNVFKALFCFEPSARENWKEYSRRLLCTVNPYTGKTLAEDPALFCINIINEDTLSSVWANHPLTKTAAEKSYKAWAQARGGSGDANAANPQFRRFLIEAQMAAHREAMDFLRNELGCGALLTSMNFDMSLEHTTARDIYDLVDNHGYHDHPRYPDPKNPKYTVMHQDSALDSLFFNPLRLAQSRIYGKPFILTEYHFCYPNAFRCESGLVAGAYAALQNWDGLYRFDWGTRDEHLTGVFYAGGFDMAADTVAQLADRVTAALFLRGDASPAAETYMTVVPDDFPVSTGIPAQSTAFLQLGLVAQVGSGTPRSTFPVTQRFSTDHELAAEDINDPRIRGLFQNLQRNNAAVSSTGEITVNAGNREMRVITPKTESLILTGGSMTANFLEINNANTFQNISVIALDDKPIPESGRMLVLQLTDSDSDGTLYGRRDRSVHLKFGRPNAIIWRHAVADITIATGHAYKITALGADGQLLGPVQNTLTDDGFVTFRADSAARPEGVIGYLLERTEL